MSMPCRYQVINSKYSEHSYSQTGEGGNAKILKTLTKNSPRICDKIK